MKIDTIVKRHGLNREIIELPDDTTAAPGPKMLIAGDMEHGFFGEVTSEELATSSEIWMAFGRTPSSILNNDVVWLKFAYKNKIIFKSLKRVGRRADERILSDLSNEKQIIIKGCKYKMRTLDGYNGARNNPTDQDRQNSEWTNIIGSIFNKQVLIDLSGSTATYNKWVSPFQKYFNLGYTLSDMELNINSDTHILLKESILHPGGKREYYTTRNIVDRSKIDYYRWGSPSSEEKFFYHLALEYVEEA